MKKMLLVSLCLLLALAAIGCTAMATPAASAPQPEGQPDSQPESLPESHPLPVPPPSNQPHPDEEAQVGLPPLPLMTDPESRLTVADAMLYRGTVTGVATDVPKADGSGVHPLVLTLTQAQGTNFGAPSLQFAIGGDTRLSFDQTVVSDWEGLYLEVFYSYNTRNAPDPDAVYNAIAVNYLGTAQMVITNGTVVEIVPHADKPGEGRYLVSDLANPGFQIFFLYGPDTRFYMNQADIQVGDQLNFYHSAAMTMSLPPQCAAWEIRPYDTNE